MKLKKLLLSAVLLSSFICTYAQEDTSLVNVYFYKSKFFLTAKAKENLKKFMDDHKNDHHLYVVGRCDKWGGHEYNDWLSIQRAQTVAKFMQANGFPVANIDTVKGYGKRKQLAFNMPPKEVDSLNRVVTITGSFAVVKQIIETKREAPPVAAIEVKKPAPVHIDTVYRNDSILVPPPYSAEILAVHKFPHKGDIIKIERSVEVRNDTPFVFKKLYVASETMEEPKPEIVVTKPAPDKVAAPPAEISEDIKASDLSQEVTDQLKKSSVGESLVIRGINFDFGYHTILKKDMPALQAVLSALKEIPTLKLEIQGHVCCWPIGQEGFDKDTKEYNLSYNRAKAVYDYLVSNGIAADRLTYNGYGMKKPLVWPEKNKKDEYRNRRVEFKIVSK